MISIKTDFYKKLTEGVLLMILGLTCQAYSVDVATLNFQRVDPNRIPDEVEMLSSAVKANFDKIKTWQGKISFEKLLIYRDADAAGRLEEFANIKSAKDPNELGQLAVGTTEFKIDLEKNILFRQRNRPGPLEYIDFDKNRSYPSSAKQFEKTIINTPEYEIACYPYTRKKDGTITSRFARKHQTKRFQWFFSEEDPRRLFYVGGPPWIQFSAISEYFRLYQRGTIDSSMAIGVVLEKAQTSEDVIYRILIETPTTPGSNPVAGTFTYLLDGSKRFNVTYIQEKSNGKTRAEITRDFVEIDGIFLPSKQNSLYYDDGRLERDEKITLSDMQVNMPIPASTFSIQNLGLQDGDNFRDEIENKQYRYKAGGELVEIEKEEN